jgi:hypothetical protein
MLGKIIKGNLPKVNRFFSPESGRAKRVSPSQVGVNGGETILSGRVFSAGKA